MSISSIIVGGKGCPISKIISTLRSCSSFHLFHEKFSDISIDLETPREVLKKFRQDLLLDKLQLADVVYGLIEEWAARKGSGATLQDLMGVLKENHLTDCYEAIENAFGNSTAIPKEYRKYSRIPLGVTNFLSETGKPKTICIIPTIDLSITGEKLRENLEDCIIHGHDDLLKIISVLPPSGNGNLDPLYHATIDSLKQIKKILTEIVDQPGKNIRLVVVTPLTKDDLDGLKELLQSHPTWERAVQICSDPMEWCDLTLAFKNEIEKRPMERFHVDLDDEDGLSGQVLVDLIHGNDFKLFKDTLPAELSYYVYRTMITRNYISPSIFNQTSPDIFLFKGMKRYELTGFVKNTLTDNSTNQIRQKVLKVKHIILDHPNHFQKICEKTSAPVHLIHFEDGRLKWLKSRRGVEMLQKNLEDPQMLLKEEMFCKNLGTETNFPIIIADSPGMGKSVLLAQIGKKLSSASPTEGRVFFILLAEFMKQIKEVGIERNSEGVKRSLQNMLCENVVGKLILSSWLNSKDGILVELLMDGFDELNPRDSELALEILQTIRQTSMSIRFWITSRTHLLHDLENSIETLGYNIQPFDEEDQIQFLTSYWSQSSHTNQWRLIEFAKECLKVIKSNMNSKQQDIAGIPLQCMLIGVVFEGDAVEYANCEHSLFPTIFISSIADLYTATIVRKFQKYRNIYMKGNSMNVATDELLMTMHVRLSLELVFPEHDGKLEHLLSPVQLEDILKIGILESKSLTAIPRFVHRTFAEYFSAWFFVNHLGAAGMTDNFVEGVFSCLDTFSNNIGTDSFAFANPVVCYFIESLISEEFIAQNYDNIVISRSLKSENLLRNIAHACVNADLVKLLQFFSRMNKFRKHENVIFDKELLLLAIEKSSVDLVKLIYDRFEKHHDFDVAIKTASLNMAVTRGDYSIVEYLIIELKLRSIVEERTRETKAILHCCVKESSNNSSKEIQQKIELIRLIVLINPTLLEETDVNQHTPLLYKHVHVLLMIELIHLGANVLAKDLHSDTVLHIRHGWRCLSCTDYHLLLNSIPNNKLKMLVNQKGKYDCTPLVSLLHIMDPTPDTLFKFHNVGGGDFDSEDETGSSPSPLETAIKNGRNGETLQTLIKCGAKTTDWKGKKCETVLHIAAAFGNLEATSFFLNAYPKMNFNIEDVEGFTSLDYVLKSDFQKGKRMETGMALNEAGGTFKKVVNSIGQTWLHLSALNGNIPSIQLLLSIGIDINVFDDERNTPLHSLLVNWDASKEPVLELMLDYNSNPSLLNNKDETPLHIALKSDELDIKTFKLLKAKTNVEWTSSLATSALFCIIRCGSDLHDDEFYNIVKEMEGNGADFSFRDDHGNSLMHIATHHRHIRAIQLLFTKHGDANMRNNLQQTLLHVAAAKESGLEVIEHLVENGVDVKAKDINNAMFLHVYVSKGPTITDIHSIVKFLAAKNLGSLFNIKGGGSGATSLQLAVMRLELNYETLSLLHLIGADFNATNSIGLSVLGYAVVGRRRVQLLSTLIKYGADLKTLDHNKCNMLHWSANYGTLESLKFLLATGTLDVNKSDSEGDTPLHSAVAHARKQGILEKCNMLIENGADINITNHSGYTPLEKARLRTDDVHEGLICLIANHHLFSEMAFESKEPEVVNLTSIKSLLESGGNIFTGDRENLTILHRFVLQPSTPTPFEFHSVCEYLVRNNVTNLLSTPGGKSGATPFQDAVRCLEPNTHTLSLMQSNCIHFNAIDNAGDTVLFYAVRGKRNTQFIKTLIEQYGADVALLNNNLESLLHCTALNVTAETLKFFLDSGKIGVNAKTNEGYSPLHAFVRFGEDAHEEEALRKYRLLVDYGSDVNSSNNNHSTILHDSTYNIRKSKHVSLKLIKQLIEDGGDIYVKDSYQSTFLHRYIDNRPRPTPSEFHDMVEFLKDKGHADIFNYADDKGTTPVFCAVTCLEPEEKTLSLMYTSGASFHSVDRNGETILCYAVMGGRSDDFLFTLITRFGVSPRNINSSGDNLLHLLARNYSLESLRYFLELPLSNLTVNGKNNDGRSLLHHTVQYATKDVLRKCKLLISHNANVNSRDYMHQTPLHAAVQGKEKDISWKTVKYLIEQCADVLAKDRNSHTFLHVYFLYVEIVALSSSEFHSLLEYLLHNDFAGLFNTSGGEYEQTPLQLMFRFLEPEMQTLILLQSRGVDFNSIDKNGDSVLIHAVKGGRTTNLLSNLMSQFGVNHKSLNNVGESVLHKAALHGTVDALKLFADLGDLDINGRTHKDGCTPLIYAVIPNDEKIDVLEKCKFLISKGADVNIATNQGHTALAIVLDSYDGADKSKLVELLHPPDQLSESTHNSASSSGTNAQPQL